MSDLQLFSLTILIVVADVLALAWYVRR